MGQVPGTVWFLLVLAAAVVLQTWWTGWRPPALARPGRAGAAHAGLAAGGVGAGDLGRADAAAAAGAGGADGGAGHALRPLVYRLAYESLADASVLVLLIVSVGVHFALLGLGLFFFGAEGFRNPSFWDERFSIGALTLSGQTVIIFAASICADRRLWLFFERSLAGKALRATAVNRLARG
jgi:branched-chain amino acid transport system permease protein